MQESHNNLAAQSPTITSWGRLHHYSHKIKTPCTPHEVHSIFANDNKPAKLWLAYGQGRSYGDVGLNQDQGLIISRNLDHFIHFDSQTGILECEAGVTLEQILQFFVPKGWFLPVTPGTQFVTVGGAIANDVHGKNHHTSGTFGCFINQLELLRSDGSLHICSKVQNQALFQATIGGLGLTGFITKAQLQLIPVSSPFMEVESIKFYNLKEFFELNFLSEKHFAYTVAWVDCLAQGNSLGRGIYLRSKHSNPENQALKKNTPPAVHSKPFLNVPFNLPTGLLNHRTISCFNQLYFHKQFTKIRKSTQHYRPFFYPLDSILNWNRIYGRNGFYQYQLVVPFEAGEEAITKIMQQIAKSGNASFLAVFKTFGSIASPGMLSFPKPGYTLALDFANRGTETLKLFETLDRLILEYQGRLYPAKDSHMQPEHFKLFYPHLEECLKQRDPLFSSSFIRRMGL